MPGTPDDQTKSAKTKPSGGGDARLARQAQALRANLRRRKAQSRGRAEKRDDDPADPD